VRLFLAFALNRMPGSAATAQYRTCRPGYGGNAHWTRRIGPDSCAWPWTNPGRNPALPKEIRTGAISSQASDQRQRGSTVASNSGDKAPGSNVGPGTGRVSKSALALRQIRLAGHSRDRTDTP
jgi:hypothetical protein